MAYLTNEEVVRRFVDETVSERGLARGFSGGTLRASPLDGAAELLYHRRQGSRRAAWGPVTLARYMPDRKLFLINGDGFTDPAATRWQTHLRFVLEREVTRRRVARADGNEMPSSDPINAMLVPFIALSAAEIDLTTIRPLHVTDDTWEVIWHPVPDPGEANEEDWSQSTANRNTWQRWYERTVNGVRFRTNMERTHVWRNNKSGNIRQQPPDNWHYNADTRTRWTQEEAWVFPATTRRTLEVRATAQDGTTDWHPVELAGASRIRQRIVRRGEAQWTMTTIPAHPDVFDEQGTRRTVDTNELGWGEEVHHLGAAIFSGVGEDEKRHKFISAFDEDEPTPLYFLAQLPDRSGATTYDEAVEALRPPLVRAAAEGNIQFYRQGDVFAIETDLTDEQVYAECRSRVRREIVMFNLAGNMHGIISGRTEVPMPAEDEVVERVPCPCNCGHTRPSGSGPKARRALSIYGTGHTATEVVVGKRGTTYVRGTMFHDPTIEEEGRVAEHRPVRLAVDEEDERKWCVAVRNTVPRRRRRRAADTNGDQADPVATATGEGGDT